MTATERLRQLLDERGVEWTYADGTVSFNDSKHWYHAWAYNDGSMVVSMGYLTPEQAVEATLGRGTCWNTQSDFDFMCSECHKTVDDGRLLGFNYCPKCGRRIVEKELVEE